MKNLILSTCCLCICVSASAQNNETVQPRQTDATTNSLISERIEILPTAPVIFYHKPQGSYSSITTNVKDDGSSSFNFAVQSANADYKDALAIQCGNNSDGKGHGRVSIGNWPFTKDKFHVYQDEPLGQLQGNNTSIVTFSANCANSLKISKWLYRKRPGTDWNSVSVHDGIAIDASYGTPGLNTRTWWDRQPSDDSQSWGTADKTYMTIQAGKVGIGTANPQNALDVNGTIRAKEVLVTDTGWADFVFEDNYELPTLEDVENHIRQNKRLPGIPSAGEVETNGVGLADMNVKLLQKVEELTLYMIEQDKKLTRQQQISNTQQQIIEKLESKLNALTK